MLIAYHFGLVTTAESPAKTVSGTPTSACLFFLPSVCPVRMIYSFALQCYSSGTPFFASLFLSEIFTRLGWQRLKAQIFKPISTFKRFTMNLMINGFFPWKLMTSFFGLERGSGLLFLTSGTVVISSLNLSNQITLIFCCFGLNKYFQDKLS